MYNSEIFRILEELLRHDSSKKEALKRIKDNLCHWHNISPERRFKFHTASFFFEEEIKKHLDLLLDFTRDMSETINYFEKAATTLQSDIHSLEASTLVEPSKVGGEK